VAELPAAPAEGDYLVCSEPPDAGELAALAGAGWRVAGEGNTPTLRRDGVTVRYLHAWTGGRTLTPAEGHAVFDWLEAGLVHAARDEHACPIGAPATTGRDLWLRTIPAGVEYPVPADDAQRWLRATGGQARVELIDGGGELPAGAVEYDARHAYLACLRELPVGRPERCATFDEPYWPGRYLVAWRAPAGWPYPFGLLRDGRGLRDLGPAERYYPPAGEGWVDAVELALAVRHGWAVEVDHGWRWPTRAHPFDRWHDALGRLATAPGNVEDDTRAAVVRAITLGTIGAMWGSPRKHTGYGPADSIPEGAEGVRSIARGTYRWRYVTPALWPDTHHPEWVGTVWARARVRLLDAPTAERGVRAGALHVEPGAVIAMRTDALYLDARHEPSWADDGRDGRYRLAGYVTPGPWPTSAAELLHRREPPR